MRTSKVSETRSVTILREADAGTAVADLLRTHKISRETFSLWKQTYGGAGVPELQRLKALEQESARLMRRYADRALALTAIKDVLSRSLLRGPRGERSRRP